MSEREIKTIGFGRACRDRLGMYLSADPEEALSLGLREIYVNSLDALTETKWKNGKIEIIVKSGERKITVIDNGPGIPNKMRDDGVHSVVAAYTMPHTGSHFDGREVNSIGLNGIGASVVTHTARWFQAISNDGKQECTIMFGGSTEGAVVKGQTDKKSDTKAKTGVIVSYEPDIDIYGDSWVNKDSLLSELTEMMKFYPNIVLTLKWEEEKPVILSYPNGLKESTTKVYYESDNLILSLSLGEGDIKPFGNRLYLPAGGAFNTHFKTQMTRVVNDLSGLKLTGAQVQSVFFGYIAIFVGNPLFSNQSKTAISNKEVNNEITMAIKSELEKFSKTSDWERVMKELETELKAEQAAQRAREKVKNAMDEIAKGSKKKVLAADKLKDCIHHGEDSFLFICEGDSAQGALNLGRDIERVATIPIRGKFINCLKNKQEDYLDNDELIQLAQVMGCGILDKYSSSKLKYGKIGIAVDADEDGKNIACLLITFFYVCMPKLIQEGRLYWIKAPLYSKKGQYIFNEEEWSKVKNKAGWKRNKGLGEMLPDEVEESMFGKVKCWEQLKPRSWKDFSDLVQELMGKEVSQRRERLVEKVNFDNIKYL